MSIFSIPGGVSCRFDLRKSRLEFSDGVFVHVNAAWHPGMPKLKSDGWLLPRVWTIARTARRRKTQYKLVGEGAVWNGNGGMQGGNGIEVKPAFTADSLLSMDLCAERHPIAALDALTGDPITRTAHIGWHPSTEYLLDEYWQMLGGPAATQLHPFDAQCSPMHPWAFVRRIDAAHLIRAIRHAIAVWKATREPRARMILVMQMFDVMMSYPLRPIQDQIYRNSLGTIARNVTDLPHRAQVGMIRWLAWCIRAVAEGFDALMIDHREAREWLRTAIYVMWMSQAESGVFADHHFGEGMDQEQPWTIVQPGFQLLPSTWGEMPAFQGPFMIYALFRAQEVLKEDESTSRVEEIVRKYLRIYETCALVPGFYNPTTRGLPRWLVTSKGGILEGRITQGIGLSDPSYEQYVWEVADSLGINSSLRSMEQWQSSKSTNPVQRTKRCRNTGVSSKTSEAARSKCALVGKSGSRAKKVSRSKSMV